MRLHIETARTVLPALVELDSDLYTSENHFLPTFEVNT